MKYLLKGTDIDNADWGRVLLTDDGKIFVKDFSPYKMVDLGLPSGIKWADRNVGASSPEDDGLYFEWGGVQGYTADQIGTGEGKKAFNWDDYKFGNELTKYNSTDNKTVLDPEDDAAHVNMGSIWRMPTHNEQFELMSETNLKLVLSDGAEIEGSLIYTGSYMYNWKWGSESIGSRTVKGVKFINKSDASKYIFVPASGYAIDGSVSKVNSKGKFGKLWSGSVEGHRLTDAQCLTFDKDYATDEYSSNRYYGIPVRGVVGE